MLTEHYKSQSPQLGNSARPLLQCKSPSKQSYSILVSREMPYINFPLENNVLKNKFIWERFDSGISGDRDSPSLAPASI